MITPFFLREGPAAAGGGVRNYGDAMKCDVGGYGRFFRGMLDGGVMLPPSQFEAWFVSTAHTEGDIDATVDVARGAMVAAKGTT